MQEVGEELIAHLETLERKRSTLGDYESYLRIHLVPFFGSRSLPDIRFLDDAELEALIAAVPGDERGAVERAIYVTAAMTGLRQGELVALRWRDIDWPAARVRVRQNYVRGEFGTPKSRRSTRSVPLADRVAGELDRHFQASRYTTDDDLVFCHPQTGNPLDRSRLLKRLKACRQESKGP